MGDRSAKRLERRIKELDEKVDVLVGEAEKTMSPYVVIILVVIAVVCGLWSELLLKKFKLLEKEGQATMLLFSVVAVVVMVLLARKINTVVR